MKIYDEYVKVLRGIYRVRFNVGASNQEISTQVQPVPQETTPPFTSTLEVWCPNKVSKHKEHKEKE